MRLGHLAIRPRPDCKEKMDGRTVDAVVEEEDRSARRSGLRDGERGDVAFTHPRGGAQRRARANEVCVSVAFPGDLGWLSLLSKVETYMATMSTPRCSERMQSSM